MIPLCPPNVGDEELQAVKEVLNSGWLAEGPKNKEFEEQFAKYIGVTEAVTLNSCTAALFLAVKGLGIKGEVILPSFTFVASANAIVTAGATPVFAEVEYDTCNVDAADIERRITPRTEAIMPVHFGGQAVDMDAIMNIAAKHKLAVIEDSAETIGGTFKNKKTGAFATGCFSFFPTKNMTTGEGGMLTTNDHQLAEKVRALAGHGISKSTLQREKEKKPWLRSAMYAGYNFRLSNILAAIGVEQLKKLDAMNRMRREHAAYLSKGLAGVAGIELPVEKQDRLHVYQMYTIKVKKNRDEIVLKLREKGIGASVHFDPPVHLQAFYQENYGIKKGDFPITERIADSIITLPMYPTMKQSDLDFIVETVKNIVNS